MRLLMVVALAWAWACRSFEVTPDRSPLGTPSSELPGWFGTPGSRLITGTLVDAEKRPLVGVVHLRIDVPDASIWTGNDQTTGTDGRFSFVVPRSGSYTLFATAPGLSSRVVEVDARRGDADVTVFAFPCSPEATVVQTMGGVRIRGARIVIGGVIVAETDDRGTFVVCANERALVASVHASGFAATTTKIERRTGNGWPVRLARAISIRGRIFDEQGRPAAGIGVQPVFVDQVQISHSGPYDELPLVVTSGADGGFVFRELDELDRAAGDKVAAYTARSLHGNELFDHSGASFGAHAEGEFVLRREAERFDRFERETMMELRTWKVRGRVVRGGEPVPDAEIIRAELHFSSRTLGFSRADGTVDIDIPTFGRREDRLRVRVEDVAGSGREFTVVENGPESVFELP